MTSHINSHRTTDIKLEMLSGVRTGHSTPHDSYNICGIAHARINRKDDIFKQRWLVQSFTYIFEWGQGTCTLKKQTRHWTYSALRHFFRSYLLRKGQNRGSLHPTKETRPARKRRRINKNKEYIDVFQTVRTNPAKQKRMNNKENKSKRTKNGYNWKP